MTDHKPICCTTMDSAMLRLFRESHSDELNRRIHALLQQYYDERIGSDGNVCSCWSNMAELSNTAAVILLWHAVQAVAFGRMIISEDDMTEPEFIEITQSMQRRLLETIAAELEERGLATMRLIPRHDAELN